MPAVVVEAIRALQPREIECVIPDLNGLPRGKALPAEAFGWARAADGARYRHLYGNR